MITNEYASTSNESFVAFINQINTLTLTKTKSWADVPGELINLMFKLLVGLPKNLITVDKVLTSELLKEVGAPSPKNYVLSALDNCNSSVEGQNLVILES
jgi:hypothetical protein